MAKSRTHVLNLLAHASPFKALNEAQLTRLAEHVEVIEAKRDTEIVGPDHGADGVYFVAFGQVKIALAPTNGTERMIALLGDGACFGLAEMLMDHSYTATAKTIVDSLILRVERAPIHEMLEKNLAFSNELGRCIARQFGSLMHTLECQSQSARQRLAGYFLKQRRIRNCDNFDLMYSRETIAALLWLTAETVSRVLHDFSQEGMIRASGRKVQILDGNRLAEVLTGSDATPKPADQ